MANYVSYALPHEFPNRIYVCPVCSGHVVREDVRPSRALEQDISSNYYGLTYGHFNHLYTCNSCPWWCIRECFQVVELAMADWLIMSTIKQWDPSTHMNSSSSGANNREDDKPWLTSLEDEHVYDDMQELSEDLERMFVEGKTYQTMLDRKSAKS